MRKHTIELRAKKANKRIRNRGLAEADHNLLLYTASADGRKRFYLHSCFACDAAVETKKVIITPPRNATLQL